MNNHIRTLGIAFGINMLVAVVFVTAALGYNSYTHKVKLSDGLNELLGFFGGLASFAALAALIVGAIIVYFTVFAVAESDRWSNHVAGALALGYVAIAVLVGSKWVAMPTGAGLLTMVFLAVLALQTFIVRRIR